MIWFFTKVMAAGLLIMLLITLILFLLILIGDLINCLR